MDQKLIAALKSMSYQEFELVFGQTFLCELLWERWQTSKENAEFQMYLLSLTEAQQGDLVRYLKVKLCDAPLEVHDSYHKLHALCTWLHKQGRNFFIKILDVPQLTNGADFSVIVSDRDYKTFQSHGHVSAA